MNGMNPTLFQQWARQFIARGGVAWGTISGTLSSQTDLQSALNAKQSTLVSGTNIKTINGSTVLGSGDLVVSGSGTVATGVEVDTGTNDTKFMSPKAIEDSSYIKAAYADAKVSDTVYGAGWNGDTGVAPSKNAVYDKIESLGAPAWGVITGTVADQTDLQSALDAKQSTSGKNAVNGYPGLDVAGQIQFDMGGGGGAGTVLNHANTSPRTYTYQDRDGTIADDTDLALKAPKASPTFTGTVTLPTGTILSTPASGTLTNCTGLPVAAITASTTQSLGVGSIELGHATDTTLTRTGAGLAAIESKGIITRVITTAYTTGSAATHTFTTGMQYCEVWVTGQGGGGGGARASDATSQACGSGGGAGGTAYATFTATEAGANAVYTVGASAGAGGSNVGGNGTAGTDSTFNPAGTGATLTGSGGGLGTGHDNATPAASVRNGGAGGGATGGTANFNGGDGGIAVTATTVGTTIPIVSGYGGGSFWGGGGRAVGVSTATTAAGISGQTYGVGGSGAAALNSTGGNTGGNGGTGFILVKEYCQ